MVSCSSLVAINTVSMSSSLFAARHPLTHAAIITRPAFILHSLFSPPAAVPTGNATDCGWSMVYTWTGLASVRLNARINTTRTATRPAMARTTARLYRSIAQQRRQLSITVPHLKYLAAVSSPRRPSTPLLCRARR